MADKDRTFRSTTPGGERGETQFEAEAAESRSFLDDRDAAGIDDAGDLGAGTPANVDVHKLGEEDAPEADWGEAVEEGTLHSANHSRRGVKTEADRGQGAKTRRRTKDIISRRR